MKKAMRSQGFTLIELMIVVVIIGILAAIAIPNFLKFQLKSKFAESANVGPIYQAEDAFASKWGVYGAADTLPNAVATPGAVKNAVVATDYDAGSGWDTVGWKPVGALYGCYTVRAGNFAAPVAAAGVPNLAGAAGNTGVCATASAPAADKAVLFQNATTFKTQLDATSNGIAKNDGGVVDISIRGVYDINADGNLVAVIATDEDKDFVFDPENAGDDTF